MSALTRTAIGEFRVENACDLDGLDKQSLLEHLQPARSAVVTLPRIELTADELREIINGRTIDNRVGHASGEIAALDATGRLAAILRCRSSLVLGPVRVFPK